MVANFSTAKQHFLLQNDLSGLFWSWEQSCLWKKWLSYITQGVRGSDADAFCTCTCTCSLPAECCAAADCSAAVCSVCRHWMINNCCCCCCCTDDNSPSAVSTDRTLHTHSCTLTQRFLQLSEVLQLVSQYNRGIYGGPDILSSANMFIGK